VVYEEEKKLVFLCNTFFMIAKEKILNALKEMPEKVSAEELIARIILLDKVENGLEDIAQGRTYTIEEVEEEYRRKWQK